MNPAAQGASLTEGKRSKRSKKADGDNHTNGDHSKESDEFDTSKVGDDDDDDDGQWTADVSEAAMRARMQDLSEGAKNITLSEDAEKTEKERIDIFYEYVKKRRDAGDLESVQAHKELHSEAMRLEINSKAPLVLVELLFSANITAEIKKHRNLLLRFTHNDEKAQKYLLGGVEQIIALHAAKLMDKVAVILKLFYDTDLLDEKVILDWAAKVSKKYVSKDVAQQIHDKAAPFIKWLKEAEEESEDSEEEDDEVEIGFDDRAKVDSLKSNVVKPAAAKVVEDDDGDDLNIDDI